MKKIKLSATLSAMLLIPQILSGAGIWLYEGGTPEMGTAGAGRGAIANSASVSLYNPAGMTQLDHSEIMVGFQPMYIDSRFSGEATTLIGKRETGDNGGNAGGFMPAGGIYYVYSYSEKLKFGLSTTSYFGLGLDFDDDWKGRHFVTEASMMTLALSPTVAYKITNTLSIGMGANILYGKLNQTVAKRISEEKFELDSSDTGYGFNLSLLYAPTNTTRFGLTYASKVEFEFKDVGPKDNADMQMSIPQSLSLSTYHQFNNKWSILSSIGWQQYSEFGKTQIVLNHQTIEYNRNFDDTWHISLGTHYQYSKPLTLMAGVAYDSSAVEDKYRTVDMPMDRQLRYALGGTYSFSDKTTLGMAYELMDSGKAKVDQEGTGESSLKGEFSTNYVHIFNINVNYKF